MTTSLFSSFKANLLPNALRSDGVFSLLSGLVTTLAARPLAALFGLPAPAVLTGLGVVIVGYGLLLLYAAGRPSLHRRAAWHALILNGLWVLASAVGLLAGWFPVNTAGVWAIIIVGEVVAAFGLLQFYALRR
ncbi:MAG: hypothetical protein AB1791_24050 [Chloroflexota bacterium]